MSDKNVDWLKAIANGTKTPAKPNPLKSLGKKRKRSPKKFYYTIEDVAALTGLAIGTLRNKANEWHLREKDTGCSLALTISFVNDNTKGPA